MSTLKHVEAATSAPAHAMEFAALVKEDLDRYQAEFADHTDHKFVYKAGTWTDHRQARIQEICYEILHLEPRITKKEAQFALRIQGPDRVTSAANAYAKKRELNGHRAVRPAPYRPLGSLVRNDEDWTPDVLAAEAAKRQAEAEAAKRAARQPRQRKAS